MTEVLTTQIRDAAIAAVRNRPAFLGATHGHELSRRMRLAQWAANVVSALCAAIGVLIVSVAAVVLGLT
jgi:hypothetical protein